MEGKHINIVKVEGTHTHTHTCNPSQTETYTIFHNRQTRTICVSPNLYPHSTTQPGTYAVHTIYYIICDIWKRMSFATICTYLQIGNSTVPGFCVHSRPKGGISYLMYVPGWEGLQAHTQMCTFTHSHIHSNKCLCGQKLITLSLLFHPRNSAVLKSKSALHLLSKTNLPLNISLLAYYTL